MRSLRIAFAGTPEFAAVSLQWLMQSQHQLVCVLTQPDRAAGRGKQLQQSPVKTLAQTAHIPVMQPETLKDAAQQQQLAALNLDVLVVVAYGLLIPQAVLDIPRFGCINVHGSLLPRWRGAAPIQRAIVAGDPYTGNTIMKMDAGLDTGDMLLSEALTIGEHETGGQLHDRLAEQGARLLITVLDDLERYLAGATPQPEEGVTYAHKLSKAEAQLDFRLPAQALVNRVRAFNPWPVAWLPVNGQPMRVWQATTVGDAAADHDPGEIIARSSDGIDVACGDGAVRLQRLQLSGKRAMDAADLLRGHPDMFRPGERLVAHP